MRQSNVLHNLRDLRVLVVLPDEPERADLVRHLKRIGCQVHAMWPPVAVPPPSDMIFFLIGDAPDISWTSALSDSATLIAVLDSEVPTLLKALLDSKAHGVLIRPLRAAGVLSSLVLARSVHGYEQRLMDKVAKVEENLKSRREIEKATRVVMAMRHVGEDDAYQFMRKQATSKRVSVAAIASSIIRAQEALQAFKLDGPAE